MKGYILQESMTEQKKSKAQQCKIIWNEFVTGSTFHGLPFTILAPQSWMRILWMLLFVGAMIVCCVQIGYLIIKYLSEPTETIKQVNIHICRYCKIISRVIDPNPQSTII